MPLRSLAASALSGPLLARRTAAADYVVKLEVAGERLPVGRIMQATRGTRAAWLWTITGPYSPVALSGDAGSLPEAREAFRLAWDALLAKAAQEGRPVVWHGSVPGEA